MDHVLVRTLKDAGMNEKEARCYLALLEIKSGTATNIAQTAGLKKSITYVILEQLIARGYATQSLNKKVNEYKPLDPSFLLSKQKSIVHSIGQMLPLLQTLGNKNSTRPEIHYVDTKEGIRNVYESFNVSAEAFFISSYAKIHEHFPGLVKQWISNYKRRKYKIQARHVIPDNHIDRMFGLEYQNAGQNVRILPRETRFETDVVLTEDTFSISSLDGLPFLVFIKSEKLAHALKPLFEIVWKSCTPIKGKTENNK